MRTARGGRINSDHTVQKILSGSVAANLIRVIRKKYLAALKVQVQDPRKGNSSDTRGRSGELAGEQLKQGSRPRSVATPGGISGGNEAPPRLKTTPPVRLGFEILGSAATLGHFSVEHSAPLFHGSRHIGREEK